MKKLLYSNECLQKMLSTDLLIYGTVPETNDNQPATMRRALALFSILLHERETADGVAIDRIKEQLESVSGPDHAPAFDAICLWSYCPLSASVALAKATPSVWNILTQDTKERLTFMMEMFAYLESFATSDDNSYRTGPGLGGNYFKRWNPNYRLANAPAILFAAHFFGDGDMTKGAAAVNEKLHGFNEERYEQVINNFDKYGWRRAKSTWTTPPRMHEDGTYGKSAKDVLIYGGETYSLDYTHSYVTKDAGTGLGVSNGGNDYRYFGFTLAEPKGIIEHLLEYNYSGGEVKSDHHYDVDKDGVDERVAWILDGSHSPYEGKIGMMKEFASGNRSSTGYCSHDFQLCVCLIAAAKTIGMYDASENKELWEIIKVGNADFLYKNEIGYQGFATGSYGTSKKTHSEENENDSYFTIKSLWLSSMND